MYAKVRGSQTVVDSTPRFQAKITVPRCSRDEISAARKPKSASTNRRRALASGGRFQAMMVKENTASANAPSITAHEPLDTPPSLENHAGHRLRHCRPPPVRGREEVLRRQEGTRRTARALGKRHLDSAVLFRPRRKNPVSRVPARHAAATDRRPIPPSRSRSVGCRRQARCARQGGLVPRLPREHGASRGDASSHPSARPARALNERDVFFRARAGSGNEPDGRHRRSRYRRSRRASRRRSDRARRRPRVADPSPPPFVIRPGRRSCASTPRRAFSPAASAWRPP